MLLNFSRISKIFSNKFLVYFIILLVLLNFNKILKLFKQKISIENFEDKQENKEQEDRKKIRFLNTALDIENKVEKIYPNRIFVSVASYRDNECSSTLDSMFKNAKEFI